MSNDMSNAGRSMMKSFHEGEENGRDAAQGIKRLKELNAENQRVIRVNVGVLRAAISEINAQVALNGRGVMTDMVLNGLKGAIGEPIAVAGEVGKACPQPAPVALPGSTGATDLLPPASPPTAPAYGDAYQGAREDLAIWKRRALDADRHVRDLVMMVKLLVRTVRKYNQESQQAKDFMEYLQREGLISTSDILRASPGEALKDPK